MFEWCWLWIFLVFDKVFTLLSRYCINVLLYHGEMLMIDNVFLQSQICAAETCLIYLLAMFVLDQLKSPSAWRGKLLPEVHLCALLRRWAGGFFFLFDVGVASCSLSSVLQGETREHVVTETSKLNRGFPTQVAAASHLANATHVGLLTWLPG